MNLQEALPLATYIYIDHAEDEAPYRVIGVDGTEFREEAIDDCLWVEVDDEESNQCGEQYAFHWNELMEAEDIRILTLTPLEFTK